jgi:hypothetical protein
MRHAPVFYFFLLLVSACQPAPQPTQRAFFYWKTDFALGHFEQKSLDTLGCSRLYIKVADIGRDAATGHIVPYTLLHVSDTSGLGGRDVVPCIFLTNETFQHLDNQQLDWLADRVAEALASATDALPHPTEGWSEVLFDCDWTARTRGVFFLFLEKMRTRLPATTQRSATIRLHQYHDPTATGVPPVERGLLMLYNTGDLERPDAQHNSIFDSSDVAIFLKKKGRSYPLPLDVALPVFSWGLVYRDGIFWKIIPEVPLDNPHFRPLADGRWAVGAPTFVSGQLLRVGDTLRVESLSAPQLEAAARLARERVDLAPDATLGWYHLDSVALVRHPASVLRGL